jgi:hypothetical protein
MLKINNRIAKIANYPKDYITDFSNSNFLILVDKIKEYNKKVKIKIVSLKDTYIDDSFKFKLIADF